MSKHTPGPWSWYQPQSTPSINPYSAAFVIGPKRVPMDKTDGFTAADAHLIAAAPDLLHALEYMLAYQYDGDLRRQAGCDMCAKARAAISKAKGESA